MLLILSHPRSIYPHKHGRVIHGNLKHIRYMPLKMMRDCRNLSVAVLLFHYKFSFGRSVSEAAPFSETYMCTNPALFGRNLLRIWKKPYDSWKKPSGLRKKPFRFAEEAFRLRLRCTANAFWKGVPNCGINFKDAYCSSLCNQQIAVKQHAVFSGNYNPLYEGFCIL